MRNIIFIAALCISLQSICAQQIKINFIHADSIMKDIKLAGKDSDFYPGLNYEALLYLYPNEFDLLKKLKPETIHLAKYEDYQGAIQELPFRSKEIKSIFSNTEKLRQIVKMVSPETEFKYGDIFLKSPDKIFVTIYGDMWSRFYGFQLEKEELKLKFEIKNIE